MVRPPVRQRGPKAEGEDSEEGAEAPQPRAPEPEPEAPGLEAEWARKAAAEVRPQALIPEPAQESSEEGEERLSQAPLVKPAPAARTVSLAIPPAALKSGPLA